MRRALGKGLAQLIGEQADAAPTEVAIDAIRPNPNQPRTVFADGPMDELVASIREVGILQPLLVRPVAEGQYEIIAGERRWRAAQQAGLATVPVVVRAAGAQATLELAIIENVQRQDIAPIECARAYRRLIDEFGLTQEAVAERVGKSRAAIANTLRLLKLPEPVVAGLEAGTITEGHARAILMAETPAAQTALFRKTVERGLSVREVEKLARKQPTPPAPRLSRKIAQVDPNRAAIEDALTSALGTRVRIEPGRIVIDVFSDDDLQRILDRLGIEL